MNFENKEQYINLINYLQKILEFYSDENNYKDNFINEKNYEESKIKLDNGHHARFALNSINDFINTNEKMNEEYNKIIKNLENNNDTNYDPNKFLNDLKKYLND